MKRAVPFIVIAFIFLSTGKLLAQGHCKGIIQDAQGKPLEFVAVMLTNSADSTQFIGTATDADGKFEFSHITYPAYFISASVIGYNTGKSNLIQTGMQDTLTIRLTQSTQTINEFTFETTVHKIEIEPGKIIMNVENSSLSTGNTALDLLRRIPGVFVDNDGNISIKGKRDVNVFVDGRPTYLSGSQLKNFLKTLNASNISKIEVLTQPDAKYDAEGNAGIINIILKKKMALGFNGTFEAWYGQGFYPKGGGSFNFNYGKGKWNIYGNYSYTHTHGYAWLVLNRELGGSSYTQAYWGTPIENDHSIKFNMDYEINKKWSIGLGINGGTSHSDWLGNTKSTFQNLTTAITDSLIIVTDKTHWNIYNLSLNLNAQWKIDSLGQKLTINADGGTYQEKTHGQYKYQYLDGNLNPIRIAPDRKYNMNPNLYLVSGKIDYENPHFLKFKLEAGIKSSYVTNDANVQYRTWDATNQEINIPQMSNHFLYQENINAIYLSLKRTFKKITISAGLRGEHTNVTGTQLITGQVNRQNYFSLFPNAGFSYNPNDNHSVSFMFSRRIDRPEYNELNPFIFLTDNYNGFQGNPYLRPQFSYNLDLNYTLFQVFTLNASYSLITNNITDVYRFDSLNTQRLVFSKSNIGQTHVFTAGGTFMMPVTKWWYVLLNGNAIYNSVVDSTLNINRSGWYGMFSGYFEFTLPKKFTIELNGYFMTQQPAGQQLVQPFGDFSAGISKKLFKDQLTLKFNVSDIFRTTKYRTNTTMQTGTNFNWFYWWDSRVFTFSASFTFGRAIKEAREREKDALFDRVGGGR
jgi:outer membrane receptor protein involved in Fe transport